MQDRSIQEGIYHIAFLLRDIDVISATFEIHTHTAEYFRNHPKLVVSHILDGDRTTIHCSKSYERTYLDHVRKNGMLCSSERIHSYNLQEVRSYTFYPGTILTSILHNCCT